MRPDAVSCPVSRSPCPSPRAQPFLKNPLSFPISPSDSRSARAPTSASSERLAQLAGEGAHVGVAVVGALGEAAHHHRLDRGGNTQPRPSPCQRDRRLREQLREHLARRLARVRQAAGEQEVGDRRQRVLVGGGGHHLAGERLGRHVHQRADEEAGAREPLVGARVGVGGDAEVEQLHLARRRIVHHVLRLQVAMDDARVVRGLHRVGDLLDDRRRPRPPGAGSAAWRSARGSRRRPTRWRGSAARARPRRSRSCARRSDARRGRRTRPRGRSARRPCGPAAACRAAP